MNWAVWLNNFEWFQDFFFLFKDLKAKFFFPFLQEKRKNVSVVVLGLVAKSDYFNWISEKGLLTFHHNYLDEIKDHWHWNLNILIFFRFSILNWGYFIFNFFFLIGVIKLSFSSVPFNISFTYFYISFHHSFIC